MADGNVQPPTTAMVTPAFLDNAPAPFLQSPDSDKDHWGVWLLAWNNYLSIVTAVLPGQLTNVVKMSSYSTLGAEGFCKSIADPVISSPVLTYSWLKAQKYVPYGTFSAAVNTSVSVFLAELCALAKHTSLARFTVEGKNAQDYIIGAIKQHLLCEDEIILQNFLNNAVTAETAEADQQLLQEGKIGTIKQRSRQPVATMIDCPQLDLALADRHPAIAAHHLLFAYTEATQDAIQTAVNVQHYSQCNNCGKNGHFVCICQSSKVTEPSSNQIATVCSSDTLDDLWTRAKGTYIRAAAHSSANAS